jgi:hypothetical protein
MTGAVGHDHRRGHDRGLAVPMSQVLHQPSIACRAVRRVRTLAVLGRRLSRYAMQSGVAVLC